MKQSQVVLITDSTFRYSFPLIWWSKWKGSQFWTFVKMGVEHDWDRSRQWLGPVSQGGETRIDYRNSKTQRLEQKAVMLVSVYFRISDWWHCMICDEDCTQKKNWKSSLLVLKIVHIFKIFIMSLKSCGFLVYSVEKTPYICHNRFKDEITVIWYMYSEFDSKVEVHTLVTLVPVCSEWSVGVIWQLQIVILLCYCECKWNSKWVIWIIILGRTCIQSHRKGWGNIKLQVFQ
jgi:hypothetical protein